MIFCKITSPKGTKKYKSVKSIALCSVLGSTQILHGHAEAFFILKKGFITINFFDKEKKTEFIDGGECYVKDNNVIIVL